MTSNTRILAWGDTHLPWTDMKKFAEVVKFARKFKPTHIVHTGDIFDVYTINRYAHSVNICTPQEELQKARKMAIQMWKDLQKVAPKAKCYLLGSNHSYRLMKQLLAKAPEFESLLTEPIEKLFTFENVYTLKSHRDELVIDNIVFVHGMGGAIGKHVKYFLRNTVIGHNHKGWTFFQPYKEGNLWELSCGNLADHTQVPFNYTETRTVQWQSGFGVIENGQPRFISL